MEAMGHQQVHHLPHLFTERHLIVQARPLIQAMTLNLLLPNMETTGKLRTGVVPAMVSMVTNYTFPSPGSFSSTYPYFAYPR